MPARHQSLRKRFASSKRISVRRLCRRKRVSARHQVKRLDRHSGEFALRETVRQKKPVFFVRCGSTIRNFTGDLEPDRDLVLTCSPTPSFFSAAADDAKRSELPKSSTFKSSPGPRRAAAARVHALMALRSVRGTLLAAAVGPGRPTRVAGGGLMAALPGRRGRRSYQWLSFREIPR